MSNTSDAGDGRDASWHLSFLNINLLGSQRVDFHPSGVLLATTKTLLVINWGKARGPMVFPRGKTIYHSRIDLYVIESLIGELHGQRLLRVPTLMLVTDAWA